MTLKTITLAVAVALIGAGVAAPALAAGFGGSDRSAPGPFRNAHDRHLEGKARKAAGFTRYLFSKKIRHINKARRNGWIDRHKAIDLIGHLRDKRGEIIQDIHNW